MGPPLPEVYAMRYVTFDFDGSPLPLMLTAGALFAIYERFGVHDSILQATGAMEDTEDGRRSCRELAVMLAQQAELWRRRQGYTPEACPAPWRIAVDDRLREAVGQAIEWGFYRAVPSAEDTGEINLVLAARADERAEDPERLRAGFLAVCAARLHLAPADALLLTPGEYLDMVTLLSGGEEGDYGSPQD